MGHQMSHIGHYVPLLAAGMEGREGYDLPSCGGGAPPGGKRRLIRGGGSAARISNGTGPQKASPAVLAKVIADDAVSLADAGIVTVDVTVWADAGSELPANPAGVVTVGVASLADARKVTVAVADLAIAGEASLADPGMVSPTDTGEMFPAVSAERVTMNVTNLTEEVHMNVVGVQTYTSWGDRLSLGVWCRDRSLINKKFACRPDRFAMR